MKKEINQMGKKHANDQVDLTKQFNMSDRSVQHFLMERLQFWYSHHTMTAPSSETIN